jgi:hypothetical protein
MYKTIRFFFFPFFEFMNYAYDWLHLRVNTIRTLRFIPKYNNNKKKRFIPKLNIFCICF